jgi:hypothetical protein
VEEQTMAAEMSSPTPTFFGAAKRWSTLLLVLGALLIALSAVGFWVQWTLMSEDGFVTLTGEVLAAPDTREAIALGLVDRLLADYPVLRALVGDPIVSVVEALLGSTLFTTIFDFVATHIWEVLFRDGGQVVINLEPLQSFLHGILTTIAPNLAADLSAQDLPSELVLLDPDQVPDMGQIENQITWLSWLALLIGLGVTIFAIWRVWSQQALRYAVVAWTGIILAVVAIVVALLTVPTRQTVVLAVARPVGRTVVATTYDIVSQRLVAMLMGLVLIGAVMAGVGLWQWWRLTHVAEPAALPAAPPLETVSPAPAT